MHIVVAGHAVLFLILYNRRSAAPRSVGNFIAAYVYRGKLNAGTGIHIDNSVIDLFEESISRLQSRVHHIVMERLSRRVN